MTYLYGILFILLTTSTQAAGLYDPAITYRTIKRHNISVHYPDDTYNLAVRTARLADVILQRDSRLLDFLPDSRLEIILTDSSDAANGSAQIFPQNIVRLYLSAPTEFPALAAYDDWLELLLTHELAHICDLDQTFGTTRALRFIFGKVIAWNSYVPQFLSEGLAVYTETKLTNTGRGRSPYVNMILRLAALDNSLIARDEANISYAKWPGPNVAYYYGGHFHLWLAEHFGAAHVAALHHTYAREALPYLYNMGANDVFGFGIDALWDAWQADIKTEAHKVAQQVIAEGTTPSYPLTSAGGDITGACYSPNGQFIVYSRNSPVDGGTIRKLAIIDDHSKRTGGTDTVLMLQTYSNRLAFDPHGKFIYFAQAAINHRFNTFNDLYRFDLASRKTKRLHTGQSLRASNPTVSPDGTRLVFVQNNAAQTWLASTLLQSDTPTVQTLVAPTQDVQHTSPTFSPDGAYIVDSVWDGQGNRDIMLFDAHTGALKQRITHDKAIDDHPTFSPDGRYILYDSDCDGIFAIYAYDRHTGAYFRITHVIGGAFEPDVSPDGRFMLFRNASARGFDIHEMPFDPNTWQQHPYYLSNIASLPNPAPRATEEPLVLFDNETDTAYSPWPTLLPLQDNWWLLPFAQIVNNDPGLTLTTGVQDVLGHHGYTLTVGTSWYGKHADWLLSYQNDIGYPTWVLALSDVATTYLVNNAHPVSIALTAQAGMYLPIFQRHLVALNYVYQQRREASQDALYLLPDLALGDFGRLQLSYSYSYALQFPYSVGLEHGVAFATSALWYSKCLGAYFDEWLLNVDGRAYINIPWFENHVVALRFIGAYALGPDYKEKFYLGGNGGTSIFTTQTNQQFPLRSLNGLLPGTGVLAGYFEYRAPVWRIFRGLGSLPLLMRTLHVAGFCDAGNTTGQTTQSFAPDTWYSLQHLWVTTGGELRQDLVLGWATPVTLRLGVGALIVANGQAISAADNTNWFFALGSFI